MSAVPARSDRILYVVDARQALHFTMVFDTARRAGWLPESVHAEHVRFGTVLGSRPPRHRGARTPVTGCCRAPSGAAAP